MQPIKINSGKIIISQGDKEDKIYLLRLGSIQVHVEILIDDYTINALGPSQWNVKRTRRTIQVADKQ